MISRTGEIGIVAFRVHLDHQHRSSLAVGCDLQCSEVQLMDHGLLLEIRHKEAIEIVKYQPLFIGIVNGRHDRPDGQVQIGVQLLRVHGIGGYVGHRLRLWFRVRRGRFALLRRLRCSCR